MTRFRFLCTLLVISEAGHHEVIAQMLFNEQVSLVTSSTGGISCHLDVFKSISCCGLLQGFWKKCSR